jgi:hypothetical protein
MMIAGFLAVADASCQVCAVHRMHLNFKLMLCHRLYSVTLYEM